MSPDALEQVLRWQEGWPYLARAHGSLRLVDPRRESWLESYSFVSLHGQGIELPVPQVEVYNAHGRFVGRVDGLWPKHATVAEADGRSKYSLGEWPDLASTAPDQLAEARFEAARRALVREKRREDALRDLGLEVVRWGTVDVVHSLAALAGRVRATWRRGDPERFTGSLRLTSVRNPLAADSA